MRLTRLTMDNFGPFAGRSVGDFAPGLTVVHGENEAGKSALRAFMRVVLFGFPRARTSDHAEYFYEPALPGGAGGTLFVTDPNGDPYAINRVEGVRGGPVAVSGARDGGDELLEELVGGVDDAFYQNVFSISLTQLQSFEAAGRDEITERIYSAGLGMGGISLREVTKRLDDRIAVYRRVRSGSLYELEKQLRETRGLLEDRRRELAGYDGLSSQLQALEKSAEDLSENIGSIRSSALRSRRLLELRDPWLRARQLRTDIAQLPEPTVVPVDGVKRLEALTRDVESLDTQIQEGDRQERDRQRRIEALPVVRAFSSREGDVREATSRIAYYQEAIQDLPKREAEAAEIENWVERYLSSLGPDWSVERVATFDDAASSIASIQASADSLAEARRSLERASESRSSAEEDTERADEALSIVRSRLARLPEAASDDLQTLERRRDRLATLEAALVELDTIRARAGTSGSAISLPAGKLTGGGIAIGGLLAIITAIVLGEVAGAVTGIIAIVAGSALYIRSRNQGGAAVPAGQDQSAVEQEVETLAVELDLELTLTVRAVVEVRNSLDREIERKRERTTLEQAVEDARRTVETAAVRLARAVEEVEHSGQRLKEADASWHALLGELNLHSHFERDDALAAINHLVVMSSRTREAAELRGRVAAMRAQNAETDRLLASIFADADLEQPSVGGGLAALRDLESRWEAHVEAAGRSRDIQRAAEDWKDRRGGLVEALERARASLEALLAHGGCTTPDEYRELAGRVEQRRQLERDLAALKTSSPELFSEDTSELDAGLERSRPEELRAELAAFEERETALREERDTLIREAGEVRAALNQLETEAVVARLHARIDELTEQLREEGRQWSVLTVARSLLDQTRAEFQEQRQPALLQSASAYFNQMTLGRYSGVRAVVGEERFEAIATDGRVVPPERLSRGAAEQLWLSIRFALVDEYSTRTPLPVVLDDLLVNFDPGRARAACSAITTLAERQQVIFLTCQPPTVAMLTQAGEQAGVPVAIIDLDRSPTEPVSSRDAKRDELPTGTPIPSPDDPATQDVEPAAPRMQPLL